MTTRNSTKSAVLRTVRKNSKAKTTAAKTPKSLATTARSEPKTAAATPAAESVSRDLSSAEDGVRTVIDDVLERWGTKGRLEAGEVLESLAILRDAHEHIQHALVLLEMQARGAS